jgi:hypothetical protein
MPKVARPFQAVMSRLESLLYQRVIQIRDKAEVQFGTRVS